jgi:hypothetical protein
MTPLYGSVRNKISNRRRVGLKAEQSYDRRAKPELSRESERFPAFKSAQPDGGLATTN